MNSETWMRPEWINAKRLALLAYVKNSRDNPLDLNKVIRDVLGDGTADDLPDQRSALRTLISKNLRDQCRDAEGKANSDYYTQVNMKKRPIAGTDQANPTYITFLTKYVSKAQIVRAIETLEAKASDAT